MRVEEVDSNGHVAFLEIWEEALCPGQVRHKTSHAGQHWIRGPPLSGEQPMCKEGFPQKGWLCAKERGRGSDDWNK
eukprot:14042347-Heterocapsa_arctica.AAC.1